MAQVSEANNAVAQVSEATCHTTQKHRCRASASLPRRSRGKASRTGNKCPARKQVRSERLYLPGEPYAAGLGVDIGLGVNFAEGSTLGREKNLAPCCLSDPGKGEKTYMRLGIMSSCMKGILRRSAPPITNMREGSHLPADTSKNCATCQFECGR